MARTGRGRSLCRFRAALESYSSDTPDPGKPRPRSDPNRGRGPRGVPSESWGKIRSAGGPPLTSTTHPRERQATRASIEEDLETMPGLTQALPPRNWGCGFRCLVAALDEDAWLRCRGPRCEQQCPGQHQRRFRLRPHHQLVELWRLMRRRERGLGPARELKTWTIPSVSPRGLW